MIWCGMISNMVQYYTIYRYNFNSFPKQPLPSNPWEFQLSLLKLDTESFSYGYVLNTFFYRYIKCVSL